MENLKDKTAKGLFWGGLSNGGQQVLNLLFGIFLARILSTADYGMVGMLSIFSMIAGALQDGGFISALNVKKDVSHKDYNAVFWTSSLVSLTIYLILFFCAPLIADFYNEPRLTPLARYIFIGFFITSLGIAPRAYLFRNLKVKQSGIVPFVSLFVSGIVGVTMALLGFAYWGIATQTIVYVSMYVGLNFYYSGWRPTLPVDFSPIREMIGFGSKLVITNIVNAINNNVFAVVLGRLYTPNVVGNYTQANKWNYMGWSLINNMLYGISQPVFAKTDDDVKRQKKIFRKLLRFTAFVSFPAMFGLALVAKEFIVILLGEKWIDSAYMLQILCVMGAFCPMSNLFSNLIIGRGHSSVHMWTTISLCIAQLASVIISAPYGIMRMIQVYVVITVGWMLVWYHFAHREIGITLCEVVKDISPYLIISLALVVFAGFITHNVSNLYLSFAIKVLFVGVAYCVILWLLRSTIFRETVEFIRKRKVTNYSDEGTE